MPKKRQSQHSAPMSIFSTSKPRHFCAICHKARSLNYHESHPLVPGENPEQGVCSRPKCAKIVHQALHDSLPPVIIQFIEFNNYRTSAGQEELPPQYETLAPYDEAIDQCNRHQQHHTSFPPKSTSSNHDIELSGESSSLDRAELSGESSLPERAELPGSFISRPSRRNFARLETIWEESPPRVNFLKKPKYSG